MPPVSPLTLGLGAASAGAILHSWITGEDADPWEDKSIFNNRMREMHGLAIALNTGFASCKPFLSDKAQLQAWRNARDSFSSFYKDVGTLVYSSPTSEQVSQAKSYASKFFFWEGEYNRLKCGRALSQSSSKGDIYSPADKPPEKPIDYVAIIKWSAIGLGSLYALKTINDLFGKRV